jgi:hypothetical protein
MMDKLKKIELHLSRNWANKVVVNDDTYFKNTYHWDDGEDSKKEAGRDIKFVHNGVELRRFSDFEDIENDRFTFTDHCHSVEELDKAKVAFIMLDEILSENIPEVINLKEL